MGSQRDKRLTGREECLVNTPSNRLNTLLLVYHKSSRCYTAHTYNLTLRSYVCTQHSTDITVQHVWVSGPSPWWRPHINSTWENTHWFHQLKQLPLYSTEMAQMPKRRNIAMLMVSMSTARNLLPLTPHTVNVTAELKPNPLWKFFSRTVARYPTPVMVGISHLCVTSCPT